MAPMFLKSEYDDRLARVRTELVAPDLEALVSRLWTNRPPSVVSFGTDGAFFQKAGLDTIVIGPGGMAQMHQPNEFITEEAIDEGLQFLERLLDEMSGCNA